MFSTKKLFAALILLFSFFTVTAQKLTIKGRIYDKDGSPVPFATVVIKGTKTGAQANASGQFVISPNKKSSTIIFSAVGYESIERKLKEKDFVDSVAIVTINMMTNTGTLTEVVVTSLYNRGEKYDLSSSSAAYLAPTASTLLSGKVSGVEVRDDVESKVRIRGTASVSSYKEEAYRDETKAAAAGTFKKEKDIDKRTSMLTAGEVNDFKKWSMWEDYNETDFKTYSDKWGLFATQRYSVQLQNKNFKAVIGETVYLINSDTKEIVWTAISDNTGKAELWNGFSNNSKDKNLVIEVKNEKKQFAAIPFSQGINHIQLNRNCTATSKVEISFVVDATGSMGDEIEYLKEELQDILLKISVKDPSLDMYTSAVFYKDRGDDYVTNLQPFTKGISSTIDFIKKQSAGGGGDYPEALKDALQDATEKMEWSADARTKIIFLLMDAPPHDEAKVEMEKLIMDAAAKGIRIVPVACSGTDKATEFIMRSMALATNGTYLFLTDDSGIGGSHIKPTTNEFKVELLNDLMQRVIEQMCFVNTCEEKIKTDEPISIFSNTEKVKIFPNPTNGPVRLETNTELKEIFVADFTGKMLMRTEVKEVKKQYNIDLSNFPSATYFIRYITTENKTGAEKIILIH